MNTPQVTKGRGYILFLLFILNLINYVDRYLPAILLPSIRKDLNLNDSQLAFITGAAFALFYSLMCLPLGRMTDHMNRRKLLAACVGLWSVATTVTGFAQNFMHMAIARFGVGVGEAGLNPCAQSMISDLYAQKGRRATAIAVFASGIPVGTVVAFLAGGNLDAMIGWRNAFIAVGVPGIILAAITWYFLKEPIRGAADGFVDSGKAPGLWETIKTLWSIRVWRYMMFGTGFSGTCNVCCTVWAPSYLNRSFGLSVADIGNFTAPALGIGGFIGTMIGGMLVDKLRSKNQRWGAWVPMVTLGLCVIPTFMVFNAGSANAAILWLTLPLVLIPTHLACFTAASQSVAPLRMRGTAPALSLLITAGIMGLGIGPQVIGGLSDLMRTTHGEESLRYALRIVAPCAAALASFFFYWGSRSITQDIADATARQGGSTMAPAGVDRSTRQPEAPMPEAPLTRDEAGVADIDALYHPTHDEYARQRMIGVMRNHAFHNLRYAVSDEYEKVVAPRLEKEGKPLPADGNGIDKVMQSEHLYRFYSVIRYNSQEMMYLSVQDPVVRVAGEMNDIGRNAVTRHPAGGSLRLAKDFTVPRYVTAQDIHLAPGCFHSEYTTDDLTQGAVLQFGSMVGVGGMAHRKSAGVVAQSVSNWLTLKYPNFKPKRILDIGTQSGKNLIPYLDEYPDAELYGVDVGAPVLRYGHAKAEHEGVAIHFSQQNAESLDFADGYFDLIVSSFFFHEVPVPATKRILKECYRLLSPGGVMAHMELPPSKLAGPVLDFMWNWDTKNNNEPSYTAFRQQDPAQLVAEAGFKAPNVFEVHVPNRESYTQEQRVAFFRGEAKAPLHGKGSWFVFGARK